MKEIERKFLMPSEFAIPPHVKATRSWIEQFYLAVGDEELRARAFIPLAGGEAEYSLTLKQGTGLIRGERPIVISKETYMQLRETYGKQSLKKHRTKLEWDRMGAAKEVVVDTYRSELLNLSVAEVEFATAMDAAEWSPPEWFGIELTGREELKNQVLWRNMIQGLTTVVELDGTIRVIKKPRDRV